MTLQETSAVLEPAAGSCTVGAVLAGLDAADRDFLAGLLTDPGVASQRVHQLLAATDLPVPLDDVRWHRAGDCACTASPDSTP